jgi:hypothetical protein
MRKSLQVLSSEFQDVMVSVLLVKGTEGVAVQYCGIKTKEERKA